MRDSSLSWQKKLAQGFSCAAELLAFLELPAHDARLAEQQFPSRIPLGFAQRMQKGNPNDPLLLQVLATSKELDDTPGYVLDPLIESEANPVKGLIHKYHGRVLLTLTGVCAVNCRYCFRRHFPYQANNPGRAGWGDAIDYIRQDTSISEVILSGGDPLLASNLVFGQLLNELEGISHVRTIRIHSRVPIVFPERIDAEFLALLTASRLHKVIVVHCNHAQELDESVAHVCAQLRQAGSHLLNQTVLLAGINDKAQVLAQLSQGLFTLGIMPYYLHLLDKVKGAAHFDLSLAKAQSLYRQLQTLVPGYLVPKLAREEPGQLSKTLLVG